MVDRNERDRERGLRAARAGVRVTRRMAVALLAAGVPGLASAQPRVQTAAGRRLDPHLSYGFRPQVFDVVRPDDFLLLRFHLDNLVVTGSGAGRRLSRASESRAGRLIVEHQPQAIAEQAFLEISDSNVSVDRTGKTIAAAGGGPEKTPLPPNVAQARIAGPSRVAFLMPVEARDWPFSLPELLRACREWPMALDVAAAPAPADHPWIHAAQRASDLKIKLDHYAAVLRAELPASAQSDLTMLVERSGARVGAALTTAAQRGRPLADAEVDRLIAQELDSGLPAVAGASVTLRANTAAAVEASAATAVLQAGQASWVGIIDLLAQLAPHPPAASVTAIELPYRLIQSPLDGAGWRHADTAVSQGGAWTELWHTRLGARAVSGGHVSVDDKAEQPVRAIWSPDYPSPGPPPPGNWALDPLDRHFLVRLTAGYLERVGRSAYTPRPSTARRLMLSALGGFLDLDGQWLVRPDPIDLESWNHRASLARDHYVKVVYAGYLFPFGHRASLVKVSERKFESRDDGGRTAVLRQRYFLIVRERTRAYPGGGQSHDGRDFPFTRIDIETKVTPDLAKPGDKPNDRLDPAPTPTHPARTAFWPIVASGDDFMFKLTGTDLAGRRVGFFAPLMFISEIRQADADITAAIARYAVSRANAGAGEFRKHVRFNGQVVKVAQFAGPGAGDTSLPLDSIDFAGAHPTSARPRGQPQFYPGVVQAAAVLPSVKHLLGAHNPAIVTYDPGYLAAAANPGQVFMALASASKVGVGGGNPPTDRFGGLVAPNITPSALSAVQGLVAGNPATAASGNFKPSEFFPSDAKLLGAFSLSEVLNAAALAAGASPKLVNTEDATAFIASFTIEQGGLNGIDPLFKPNPDSRLKIIAKAVVPKNGDPSNASVEASLTSFKINLFGFIILSFIGVNLSARSGQKTDVQVDMDPDNGVLFGGPLEFVNTLRQFIPSNGFSDPPSLQVTPAGITAGYSLGLPTIGVGVLSLQNVSLGAGFDLPFTGEGPSVRFNFAERHSPFNLTVSLFGGGGFFAISLDTHGMRELEAALEFGAQISIDLGVASGGVYIKGGFYFHWRATPNKLVEFEGYVELGGHLSVLGIITVSLTFHLALDYEKTSAHTRLYGQATLTVEIEILFFSVSVDVHVEKEFAGSDGDPRIADMSTPAQWASYCKAFA
jgi:hypothetical protein